MVSNAQKLSLGADEVVEDDKMYFTPEEIHLILDNIDPKWGPLVSTAEMTGMREGELLGLMWDDIDWNSRQFYVRRTLHYRLAGSMTLKPKTLRERLMLIQTCSWN